MSGDDEGRVREARRQQALMAVLLGDAAPVSLATWLGDGPDGRLGERLDNPPGQRPDGPPRDRRRNAQGALAAEAASGLAPYRAHAAALAERVLGAAYPTVRQLVGDEAFAVLARREWQRDPPRAGDMALWGEGLAAAIAATAALAGEPYLADVARLDWAVHSAERAPDGAPPAGLQRLADADPQALRLRLAPGTALVVSAHPVATLRAAHAAGAAAADWQAARDALAAQRGENALVVRSGWRAEVTRVDDATARFVAALLAGTTLADALAAAGGGFDFEAWLIGALRAGGIAAVEDAGCAPPP